MLEKYANIQSEFYHTIVQAVKENHSLSHAYFIETNGYSDVRSFGLAFAKFLICPNHLENNKNCGSCSLCHMIENGSYSDLKIIEPDGQWIKKEQMLELQEIFKTKSLENGLRIYLIFDADCLNKAAANSILKFLEDPEEGIVAVLFANNRYQVLDTIVSRCQLYRLINYNQAETVVSDDIMNSVLSFIHFIEEKGVETIAYLPEFWNSTIKNKESFLQAIDLLQKYYESLIEISFGRPLPYSCFSTIASSMQEKIQKYTIPQLINQLQLIYHLPEKIKFNANQSLLMDKLIIDLCGGII